MSPRAACRLEQLGFAEVSDYAGGKMAWMGAGLPTEGSTPDRDRGGALARRDVLTCDVATTVDELRRRVSSAEAEAEDGVAVVLAGGEVVVGAVDLDALPAQGGTTAGDVMDPGPSTFRPSLPVAEARDYVEKHDIPRLLITRVDGSYVGVVRRHQLQTGDGPK